MNSSMDVKMKINKETGYLLLLAIAWFILLTVVNIISSSQYGFHRDELAVMDNARYLDWGYVEYPPFTPLITRLSLDVFGPSLIGMRTPAVLAFCLVLVITGLMVKEMGGSLRAQLVAASAVAISPILLFNTSFLSYQTFDFLWCVLLTYLLIRLIKSENPRWWLGIGACIGLGLMTKLTMAFFVAGLAAGVLITPNRRYLKSRWLWAGAALAFLIWLPNIIWQFQHEFLSFQFLGFLHIRDIQAGRTTDFLLPQLYANTNIAVIVLWIIGLRFYGFKTEGKTYRLLAWMFVAIFILFLVGQGRFYYLAPAYPMLLAAGSWRADRWMEMLSKKRQILWRSLLYGGITIGGLVFMAIVLPLAPINSTWWKISVGVNGELKEKMGWTELTETVANIYKELPDEERARTGILAGNYGEAGAINLYGPQYGLPEAISGIDSLWLRGYGNPPPESVIAVGFPREYIENNFKSCTLAGHTSNRFGVLNEETRDHPDIFLCHSLKIPWSEFWETFHYFG